ncbi:MAG: flagellar protein export ATPase FliI [Gammaproteobacteria bacterium]|nr:flagellar protein export ATPase FliI [Gammaproteobacteria bacterium]NNF60056.1 flagellar protein export ATPase FliI [Gammaproteobacteria bacterium]NNM19987.1 flagellar protein export ATPase FliI [Gammaproteobacteria bacterium]
MTDQQADSLSTARVTRWLTRLEDYQQRVRTSPGPAVEGVLRRVIGMTMEAEGCQAPVGARCHVIAPDGNRFEAEVVGFAGEKLFLMPTGDMRGIVPNARIIPAQRVDEIHVGEELLGRVIDGAGQPLDGLGPIPRDERVRLAGTSINPLQRQPIREPLDVGIRAINSLLTVGRGQRLGLFAGSGVGKSRLLGMMTRFTSADVTVVGLIGERGREVKEFVEDVLGPEGMRQAVVVATPADNPPLMRMHGAFLATSIAEYFRDRGKKVLLLMDSLTRFAQAQREIALAIGEPPATRGYPPSVFARLPQLVERAGNGAAGKGSITAFYTVLVEGDDQTDPIADASRAILDGHIVLSRQLAEAGLYPAIDVEASISRAMTEITSEQQQERVRRFRQLYSTYRHNEDLISVGAYRKGSDPRIDDAIKYWPRIQDFMRQGLQQPVNWQNSLADLEKLLAHTPAIAEETTET